MSVSLIIENLDPKALVRLESEARRRRVDLSTAASELLKERLCGHGDLQEGRSLEELAGTWTAEEAEEFESVVADFERIDPELWP